MSPLVSKLCDKLGYLWSLAVGGMSGPVISYVQANLNIHQIDWHKAAEIAAVNALIAVVFHNQQPPNKCSVDPPKPGSPPNP